jgi:hypothetical protein
MAVWLMLKTRCVSSKSSVAWTATDGTCIKVLLSLVICLCIFTASLTRADEHHQPATLRDIAQPVTANRIAVRDPQVRRAVLGKKADAATAKTWRMRNIERILEVKRPEDPVWVKSCSEKVSDGDLSCLGPDEIELIESSSPLTNATPSLASSVGMLLLQKPGKKPMPLCTISLVQANAGLTALHCWNEVHGGGSLKVFFPYEGIRDVDLDTVKPFELSTQQLDADSAGMQPEIDLVIMEFSKSYTIIPPEPVVTGTAVVPGSKGIVIGYGFDVEDQFDHGISREATVYVDSCIPQDAGALPAQTIEGKQICFSFDPEDPTSIAMMGFDSGGPMFQVEPTTGSQVELPGDIIGVAKGGRGVDTGGSLLGQAVYLNLADPFYQPWLTTSIASSGTAASTDYSVLGEEPAGTISPITAQVDYRFEGENEIPKLARELIVTLNHQPGRERFPDNLDLQLPHVPQPGCTRLPTVEVCSVQCPKPGPFEFSVGWGDLWRPDGRTFVAQYDVEFQMTAIVLLGEKNDGECDQTATNGDQAVGPNSTGLILPEDEG